MRMRATCKGEWSRRTGRDWALHNIFKWPPHLGLLPDFKKQGLPSVLATKTPSSQSRGPGSIPGQGTRSHMLQLRPDAAREINFFFFKQSLLQT